MREKIRGAFVLKCSSRRRSGARALQRQTPPGRPLKLQPFAAYRKSASYTSIYVGGAKGTLSTETVSENPTFVNQIRRHDLPRFLLKRTGTEGRGRWDADHTANLNLKVKVLDFVKFGGPILTVDRTIFEMWLGDCKSTETADPGIAA